MFRKGKENEKEKEKKKENEKRKNSLSYNNPSKTKSQCSIVFNNYNIVEFMRFVSFNLSLIELWA